MIQYQLIRKVTLVTNHDEWSLDPCLGPWALTRYGGAIHLGRYVYMDIIGQLIMQART